MDRASCRRRTTWSSGPLARIRLPRPLTGRVRRTGDGASVSRPATIGIDAAAGGRRDSLMDRRAFIGSLALGILAAPRAAPAQPARKVYRIGILSLGVTSDLVGPQPRHQPSTLSYADCASSATCMESTS